MYTVTNKGSILMPKRRLALPGTQLTAADFKGYESNLRTLLRSGALTQDSVRVSKVSEDRDDALPAVPHTLDPKRSLTSRTRNTAATEAKLQAIALAQKEREEKRAEVLEELEGDELTPEQAKAQGIIG